MRTQQLEFAYNAQPCTMSFEMFCQIYQNMKRLKEIESLGLSGLSDRMYPDERQEYRNLNVWMRQREIFFGDGMREIHAVLDPLLEPAD